MIRRIDIPPPMPLPLLITGVAGVPGYNAMAYFSAKYPGRVVGIRQVDNVRLVGPGVVPCNAEDRAGLARLFAKHQFAAVLDCAGNCALKQCEVAPELAWRINVEGVQNLLSQTVPRGLRLVHLSCDLVFSGADGRGGYVETDPTDPVTVYGQTMVAGEEASWRPIPGPAFCGFRSPWASVSAATPGPSTGLRRGSRNLGQPRCTSTRSARPPTPIASIGSAKRCSPATVFAGFITPAAGGG